MCKQSLGSTEGPERRQIKRLSMFIQEDATSVMEENELEEAFRADIEILQRNGLQNIEKQYRDMLTAKIEEMDRVKKEINRDNSYFKKLCKKTEHWKIIFEKGTLDLAYARGEPKPVAGKRGIDMQSTVYEEPLDDEIGKLLIRGVETEKTAEDDDDTLSGNVGGKRQEPVGIEAVCTFSDLPGKEIKKNKDKCIIL